MVFRVVSPIPGFAHIQSMELTKIDDFFMRLKSLDDETSFTLANPFMLREYTYDLPQYYKDLLEISQDSAVLSLVIMIVSTPIESSTLNFIAPLIFNVDNKTMAQVLLDQEKHPDYGLMEPISNFLEKEANEA
jgi:flagellar assembly factor FliW